MARSKDFSVSCATSGRGASVVIRRRSLPEDQDGLPEDLHPLLRRLYLSRGVSTEVGCRLPLSALHPADSLLDIDRAAALLADRVINRGSILVVGDYDADGATGVAVAVRGLRAMGAERVTYLVPSRFTDGYGLSPEVVDAALPYAPDLILTVDNGISSLAGVARARGLGIPVVVTDHHLAGDELPGAAAIVNPNRPGDPFPSKHLAGVGVVFYLLAVLRSRLRDLGWLGGARPVPNLADLLDLVALGTVADVVTLDANNRILVDQGLRRIRARHACPGILALLETAGRDPAMATSRDLGFLAGPRLNAAGRLEDMSLGVECLLTDDPSAAMRMAGDLDRLNRRRREIEDEMKLQAEAALDGIGSPHSVLPQGLCLYEPEWHQGVVGILAARVRERHRRPVVAFADVGGGMLRGSARSVAGIHVRDLLARVSRGQPGLVERFGGHAMAAGLTIKAGLLDAFRDAFVSEVRREAGDAPPVHEILSDGELPPDAMDLETASLLRDAGPWGKGFPEPVFDGRFLVLDRRVVGQDHLKLKLRPDAEGPPVEAIGFRLADRMMDEGDQVRLAYRLEVNEFRGRRSPQLVVEHIE